MTKPVTMTIDVEEAFMGKVWRALDNMRGVATITIHGSGHKPGPKKAGGTKRGGAMTVECIILGALKDQTKPIERDLLNAAAVSSGKMASSVPDSLNKLKNKKLISSPKVGFYKITPAGRTRYEKACIVSSQQEEK